MTLKQKIDANVKSGSSSKKMGAIFYQEIEAKAAKWRLKSEYTS